jgi:hypothetical protein
VIAGNRRNPRALRRGRGTRSRPEQGCDRDHDA